MVKTRNLKRSSSNPKSPPLREPLDSHRIPFVNVSCERVYEKIASKDFILEKKLDLSSGYKEDLCWFSKFNLGNIFNGLGEGFDSLTRVFYANIHDANYERMEFKTMIGRKRIVVDRELISRVTDIPLGDVCVPRPCDDCPTRDEISMGLCEKKVVWNLKKFPTHELDVALLMFGKLGIPNLCPSSIENSWWSYEFAELVFLLVSGKPNLDICGFIIFKMMTMTTNIKKLGYPCLISRICGALDIDPIGNSLGKPTLVRPITLRRVKENVLKRKRLVSNEEANPLSLMEKVQKEIGIINARLSSVEKQVALIGSKHPELKDELETIVALCANTNEEVEY